MDKIISVVNDLVVIIFDLLIFTKMVSLKRDTLVHRIVMYGGCGVIILAYFVMAYVYGYPSSVASVVCMSIPSLVLFFILDVYKRQAQYRTGQQPFWLQAGLQWCHGP